MVRTLALRAINNIDPNHKGTLDLDEFDQWVRNKYARSYCATIMCYVQRFCHLVYSDNLSELGMLPNSIKNDYIKSLIILSKYLGIYADFTQKLRLRNKNN